MHGSDFSKTNELMCTIEHGLKESPQRFRDSQAAHLTHFLLLLHQQTRLMCSIKQDLDCTVSREQNRISFGFRRPLTCFIPDPFSGSTHAPHPLTVKDIKSYQDTGGEPDCVRKNQQEKSHCQYGRCSKLSLSISKVFFSLHRMNYAVNVLFFTNALCSMLLCWHITSRNAKTNQDFTFGLFVKLETDKGVQHCGI